MRINGEETDILRSYRSNDAEGRLAIMNWEICVWYMMKGSALLYWSITWMVF